MYSRYVEYSIHSQRLQFRNCLDNADQDFPTFTPPPGCNEFELRLTNTSFTSQNVYAVLEGNVEICINGTYVAICDIGWDDVEAQLACDSTGYAGAPYYRKFCTYAMGPRSYRD
jgi:hypothetical protein